MRIALTAFTVILTLAPGATRAQVTLPPDQSPTTTAPAAPVPAPQTPVVPPAVSAPSPLPARVFTAPAGLIFTPVRSDRTVDFELVIGYLQAAMARSTDSRVRAQADGWRVFKASEPGPNGTALYVFVIDPAVAGAEYGLGRILSDAYPDQIQEIWKLYTGSLAGGGTLLNLTPVQPPATLPTPPSTALPAPSSAPPAVPPPASPVAP